MEMTMGFPLLLLICSLSTAQLQSDNEIVPHHAESQGGEPPNVSEHQQSCPQDIHAVLREMSASLAEQRVEMRHLQRENEAQTAKLRELELQKTEVERLKQELQVQAAELITVKARSNVTENQVEALKRDGEGFFIAPVRGAYHFEFYVYGPGDPSYPSGAVLFKNGEKVCIAYEHQPSGAAKSSNGATLLLEVGDVVFLRLFENSKIFDNGNHHSTFSGHLLFTM
ncbi:Collagen alpha-1(VIII) chain [Dissostichus eleginoides]|uniref:Collagen alpha-1(VIII) chain n=1 Tax=Dissostichus eleginoides TaxID=100907 RepID=A0AAD9BMQ8_DISEL|nr:Collagen alpha-1(VIII) chain [Dissostichus eleginoides]